MIDVTLKSFEMIQQSSKATYISTFDSTSQRWSRNSASAAQRSGRLPVYGNRRKIWGNSRVRNGGKRGFYVPKFEMDEARTLIPFHQTLAKLPNRSRMLFLSQSLEGFTANLPSLVAMSGDSSDHDVWLGFRFGGNRSHVNIGQFTKAGQQWAFYSLHRLRRSLVGEINDDTYSAVSRLWFLILKAKQGVADATAKANGALPGCSNTGRNSMKARSVKDFLQHQNLGIMEADENEDDNMYENEGGWCGPESKRWVADRHG